MVVARKSNVSSVSPRSNWFQRNSPSPLRKRRRPHTRIESTAKGLVVSTTEGLFESTHINQSNSIPLMSNVGTMPLWLLRLFTVNRYSSIVAFLLVATTLIVYGWTVYSQELWSQTYRHLQNLQRQERQLITTNATLTSKMADEAELPATGLLPPSAEGTIFLLPAVQEAKHVIPRQTDNLDKQHQNSYPLGY